MDYDKIVSNPQATRYVVNFMHQTGLLQQFRHVRIDTLHTARFAHGQVHLVHQEMLGKESGYDGTDARERRKHFKETEAFVSPLGGPGQEPPSAVAQLPPPPATIVHAE
ncbi:hypothetical protein PDIDSM_5 [Penicillium digitatum]|nr:hypothetical protein PDIDSM_5 [Penicillium digitatum]